MNYEYLDVAPLAGYDTVLSSENTFFLDDGTEVPVDVGNPLFTGRELLNAEGLRWKGWRELEPGQTTPPIRSFYSGLILRDDVKCFFEERGVKGIQYIPLSLDHKGSSEQEQAWYGQVHYWTEPFELSSSKFEYYDWPGQLFGTDRVMRTLGDRPIRSLERLVAIDQKVRDDVFLAKFPNETIWERIYFSRKFAQLIRAYFDENALEKMSLNFERRKPQMGFLDSL